MKRGFLGMAALLAFAALWLFIAVLLPRPEAGPPAPVEGPDRAGSREPSASRPPAPFRPLLGRDSGASAEETVQRKLGQFARSRHALLRAYAQRLQRTVPEEVSRFFALVEAGEIDQANRLYEQLLLRRDGEFEGSETLRELWPPILETFGVAGVVGEWPPQRLLDFGQAILGALEPDMVYLGGTDAGRFIPTLLNETSGGDRHVILTQNALADQTYLRYVEFLYEDRLKPLSGEDSATAFQAYLADAQKRVSHDQAFPDAPRQVRPGEDIRVTENRLQVSGQVAVMDINERLLTTLMKNNPGFQFAMEESFAFKKLGAGAVPLGPILRLGAEADTGAFDAGVAAQTVDYWRATLPAMTTAAAADSPERQAWAKLAVAQAGLLAERQFFAEAEATCRLALELAPDHLETRFRLAEILTQSGRPDEARVLLPPAQVPGLPSPAP